MSLSVKTRFEVFKRDRFTCSYCGRTPPEVLLEADHIVPRAAGGSDDLSNLTTACATCNRGKAARLLEEGTAPVVGKATVEELAERVEQAKAYMELLGGMQSLVDQQISMIFDAWGRAFGAEMIEQQDGMKWQLASADCWPSEHSLKVFLKKMSLEGLFDAIDIAAHRMHGQAGSDATRYFYGVCHRSIREARQPSSPPPLAGPTEDQEWEAMEFASRLERERLGHWLKSWGENGYSSLHDAVLSLWPED